MTNPSMKLYHYWRSSSSWRVRWALELKNIAYEPIAVSLLNDETETPEQLARNPAAAVPVLEVSPGQFLTESLAIISYLEAQYPAPSLFSGSAYDRAKVWALAEVINSGTHPLQNLPVLGKVSSEPSEQKKWAHFWIKRGLELFEKLCAPHAGTYSYGNELTLADLCLIPQCYNADRYEVNFKANPTIARVYENCMKLESLQKSHPSVFQPADFKDTIKK